MARVDEVGHIPVAGGIVCHGCGAVVYMASDALNAHVEACAPLREYNRKRLAGEPIGRLPTPSELLDSRPQPGATP